MNSGYSMPGESSQFFLPRETRQIFFIRLVVKALLPTAKIRRPSNARERAFPFCAARNRLKGDFNKGQHWQPFSSCFQPKSIKHPPDQRTHVMNSPDDRKMRGIPLRKLGKSSPAADPMQMNNVRRCIL